MPCMEAYDEEIDMIRCDMMWYDVMWNEVIWYDLKWYDMMWFDSALHLISLLIEARWECRSIQKNTAEVEASRMGP